MKKFLCTFLSLLMILSLAIVPTFADAGYSAGLIDTTLTQAEVEALPRPSDFVKPISGDYKNCLATSYQQSNYDFNYDTEISGTEKDYFDYSVYQIKDYKDMVALSILGQWGGNQFATNKPTFYLTGNIDMSGVTGWHAIGDTQGEVVHSNPYFIGTFDGRGFAIKNLKAEGNDENGIINVALFGSIKGATIKNLVIDSTCSFTYTGTNANARTAALVGYGHPYGSNYWYIKNVENNANVTSEAGYVGGLMGTSNASTSKGDYGFYNCTNNGDVTAKGTNMHAGGIIGYAKRSHGKIYDCVNTGAINATGYAGGIAAGVTSSYYFEIYNCQNSGAVEGAVAGGILGLLEQGSTKIQNCSNTGKVTATDTTGTYTAGQVYGKGTVAASADNIKNNVEAVNTVSIIGYQKQIVDANATNRSVRLVGKLTATEAELANYANVGLIITATYTVNGKTVVKELNGTSTTVYEALTVIDGGVNSDPTEITCGDGEYFFAVVLKNIPTSIGEIDLQITPYSVDTQDAAVNGFTGNATVDVASDAING